MSVQEEYAINSVKKEVKRIEKKIEMLTSEDKAGRVFLVAGVLLISCGLILAGVVYNMTQPQHINFLLGFLATEILISGYSLMHKSLRGAWL